MNRTNKAIINSISIITLQFVTIVSGFITPIIILRVYGSEINGLVSSISQIITYFNIVEVGLTSATIYSLYKPITTGDHYKINGIISAANKFYFFSGYFFSFLVLGLAIVYPLIVKPKHITNFEISTVILILGVSGTLEFFLIAKYRTLLTADQKTYILSLVSIVSVITNTILIVVFANMRAHFVLLRLILLFSVALRFLILYLFVKHYYNYLDYKVKPNYSALSRRWDAFYIQIAGIVHTSAPIILSTVFTNLIIVSIYSVYNTIIFGIVNFIGSVTNGLVSSFGEIVAKDDKDTLQKVVMEYETIYYSLISIVYSILFITILPFIKIYTSGIQDANYVIPILANVLVLDSLIGSIRSPQGMMIISAGMYKETKIQSSIQALISFGVGAILVQFFGLVGIAIGSIISNIYRNIDTLIFVPRKITGLPVYRTLFKQIRVCVNIIVIVFSVQLLKINPNNYIEWFIYACCIGFYAVVIVFGTTVIFDKDESLHIQKRVLDILNVLKSKMRRNRC